MTTNGEPLDHHKGYFLLAIAALLLSTGSVLVPEPLIKGPDKISIFLPVYAYLYLLNPLTFYLNMLLLLLRVATHAGAPQAPLLVFVLKHLPRAAHVVSFANLLFGMPLWMQAAVTEESVGLAIGAALLCLALVTILISVFKKLLISGCHAGRDFVPALLALCTSTGFFFFFDMLLSITITNYLLIHTALNFLLLFVIFIIFILGITMLILRISAPAEMPQAAIQAKHLAIVALSVAFAILVVGVYTKAYVAVTDMAVVAVEAVGK